MSSKIYLPFLISLLAITSCSTNGKSDPDVDRRLHELLDSDSFFKLRSELEKSKDKLSQDRILYYRAYCNNVFDNCEESNSDIEVLLSSYDSSLNDSIRKNLLDVKALNAIRLYKYKEAAEAYAAILNSYMHIADSSDIAGYTNMFELFSTIAEVKPQLIHKHNDVEIKGYYDKFSLLRAPVQSGGINEDFVFDSGANLSTVTQSYADKMGMSIYESDISVGTAAHDKVRTKLGATDSLYVGDLLFENVVFLVLPDESLSFPSQDFYIRGIIGFPVMHQMEEVRLCKDGSIFIPLEPQHRQLSNMYLKNMGPVVQLISNTDTLALSLDTGANTTDLSKRYYDSHKDEVERNGTYKKTLQSGAAGISEKEEYVLQSFPFIVGSKSGVLDKISVTIDDFDFLKDSDGNLGQDIISRFDEMILCFKYMYLDFS